MSPRRVRRAVPVAALLVLALVVSACTGMPDSGPVVDADAGSSADDRRASQVNPAPPDAGMTAPQVVQGFLDAMTASPTSAEVARLYLTADAAAEWEPERGTVTYEAADLSGDSLSVSLELNDAQRLSSTGAWVGRLSPSESQVEFDLTVVDGEYRITDPPDELIVPLRWFSQRYRPASLYFFDTSGRILVPQPVFVPLGDQLGSSLVAGLAAGPGPGLSRVVRTYLPAGVSPGLSVTVSEGIAQVDLGGEPADNPGRSTPATEQLLAQLAWTLGQDRSIRYLRVTLGGAVLRSPSGSELYAVDEAERFGPYGADPSSTLYAVRDRVLTTRDGNALDPVPGAFGTGADPISAAAVNIDGTRAAGVGLGGRSLLVAALADPDDGSEPSAQVVLRGEELLTPAWDFADRIWVVDRTSNGAVVHVVAGGRDQEVEVAGVTGTDVSSFLVSRDGTRIVAVVRGRAGDALRVGRVEVDGRGAVSRVATTLPLVPQSATPQRIDDIGWSSPTTVVLLTPLETDIYEVRTVAVDGNSGSGDVRPVPGSLRGLASTPLPGLPTFVITDTGFQDVDNYAPYGVTGTAATDYLYAG